MQDTRVSRTHLDCSEVLLVLQKLQDPMRKYVNVRVHKVCVYSEVTMPEEKKIKMGVLHESWGNI
jgi:hypothetical protein